MEYFHTLFIHQQRSISAHVPYDDEQKQYSITVSFTSELSTLFLHSTLYKVYARLIFLNIIESNFIISCTSLYAEMPGMSRRVGEKGSVLMGIIAPEKRYKDEQVSPSPD